MYINDELSQIVIDALGNALIEAQKKASELEQEIRERKQSDIVNEANARFRNKETEMRGENR